ncbi:DUF6174 domain-containing protein [Marinimicrobium agarilyticum]|uniref:DUF6174 domain-containing protein n=1 Tax=Marinimicrobium agarilyticum TaxID=306546 RepID=UPI0004158792|nr:DUF6174 domain-containing protein [Marinimicrobium agarilyticum]
MQTFMISMNIASNGDAPEPQTLLELRRKVRDWSYSAESELVYHRQLWQLSGFDSYQFTLSRRGGGLPAADIRVRVSEGQVVSAHHLETGAPVITGDAIGTVEDYFWELEQALRQEGGQVRVEYHSLYGYPLSFCVSESLLGQSEHRQLA